MIKPDYQDCIDFFNMAIEPDGKKPIKKYLELKKKIFQSKPDFDAFLFINTNKSSTNGAEKFADYMTKDRIRGKYYIPNDSVWRNDKEKEDYLKWVSSMSNKRESLDNILKKLIKEELKRYIK